MDNDEKGYGIKDKRGLNNENNREENQDDRYKDDESQQGIHPKIDIQTLIMGFASAAMIGIGEMPDPDTGTVNMDLDMAQQNIDIISLLHEKTRGNLTGQEASMIEEVLYQLRVSFVESKRKAQ